VAPHWPRGVHGRHDSPHGFPLGARGWGIMPSTPTISLASVVFPCQVRTVDSHAVWMIGGYRLDKAGERFTREGQRASSRPSIRPLAKSTASHRYLAAVVLALVGTHQLHEFAFAAVLHLPRVKRIAVCDQYQPSNPEPLGEEQSRPVDRRGHATC
jgi:hypothetical protein